MMTASYQIISVRSMIVSLTPAPHPNPLPAGEGAKWLGELFSIASMSKCDANAIL